MTSQVVLPGDIINKDLIVLEVDKIVLGPGLRKTSDNIIATTCGLLKFRTPNVYWIDCHQKRYIPKKGEKVLGTVIAKTGEYVRVDIGSSEPAMLSLLSFEGATRRNKPIIQVGDLIYGQLLVASKDMEPEMVCVDKHGKKGLYGLVANEGFVFAVSLDLIRIILAPQSSLLEAFGKRIKYEIIAGMNGRVWIKGTSAKNTMLLYNALLLGEYMTTAEITDMISQLFRER